MVVAGALLPAQRFDYFRRQCRFCLDLVLSFAHFVLDRQFHFRRYRRSDHLHYRGDHLYSRSDFSRQCRLYYFHHQFHFRLDLVLNLAHFVLDQRFHFRRYHRGDCWNTNFDVLWLIGKLRLGMTGVDMKANKLMVVFSALTKLLNMRQGKTEANDSYRRRFKDNVKKLVAADGCGCIVPKEAGTFADHDNPTKDGLKLVTKCIQFIICWIVVIYESTSFLWHNTAT